MEITKDMLILDVLQCGNAEAIEDVLHEAGMHCLGCVIAHAETVEQAAMVHGLDPDELVAKLNEAAKK